jgi:hypothetical protein
MALHKLAQGSPPVVLLLKLLRELPSCFAFKMRSRFHNPLPSQHDHPAQDVTLPHVVDVVQGDMLVSSRDVFLRGRSD